MNVGTKQNIQGVSIVKKTEGVFNICEEIERNRRRRFFLEFDIKNQSVPLNLCTQILPPPQLCALKFCPPPQLCVLKFGDPGGYPLDILFIFLEELYFGA